MFYILVNGTEIATAKTRAAANKIADDAYEASVRHYEVPSTSLARNVKASDAASVCVLTQKEFNFRLWQQGQRENP